MKSLLVICAEGDLNFCLHTYIKLQLFLFWIFVNIAFSFFFCLKVNLLFPYDHFLFLSLYEQTYKQMFFFSVQITCCNSKFERIFTALLLICLQYCKVPGMICVRAFDTVTILIRREKCRISNFSAKLKQQDLIIRNQRSDI